MDPVARLGDLAPDFALADGHGLLHRLSDERGHVAVLNFWSADCPHAKRVDAVLATLEAGWGDRVVVWLIASNVNEPPERLEVVRVERGLDLVLLDPDHVVADRYGAVTTPHVFVIDAEGVLRYAGAPDDVTLRRKVPTRDYLAEAVGAVLAGQMPNPAETAPFGCIIVRYGT